jgi:hypothetical protein
MNANFGLVDEPEPRVKDKRRKRELLAERALHEMARWRDEAGLGTPDSGLAREPARAAASPEQSSSGVA